MYHTYILISQTSGRLYIGHTNNVEDRLRRHNAGLNISTRNRGPWELLHFKTFGSKQEAAAFEYKLKSWKSHKRVLEWIAREKSAKG